MRAAVLREYGAPLSIERRPDPEPAPDGVVVETAACGICRSDWHAWRGHGGWIDDRVPTDFVLGHEPAGEVVAVGDRVAGLAVGDRVVVPFSLGCGRCSYCRDGRGNVCPDGRAIGFSPSTPGAFAERLHVPAAEFNVARLPDGVSPREAAALGCRFVTAHHALAHRADLAPGDWVAIHGCGGVGLSAVQVAAALGARPIAVDVDPAALSMAEDCGAVATVRAGDGSDDADGDGDDAGDRTVSEDPENTDVPAAIRDRTDGGADVSVDALGIAETCRNSIRSLDRTGQHLQVGYTTDREAGEVAVPVDHVTMHELELLGSRGMPPARYGELFGLLDRDAVDPGALVTDEVALTDVSDRLRAMDDYGTVGVEVVTEF